MIGIIPCRERIVRNCGSEYCGQGADESLCHCQGDLQQTAFLLAALFAAATFAVAFLVAALSGTAFIEEPWFYFRRDGWLRYVYFIRYAIVS
jgi:hypothetical protein